MTLLIRRSNLLVPATDAAALHEAWRSNADAITLDLEDGVAPARKAEARALVRPALAQAKPGRTEVFVRVNKPLMHADLAASVWGGLHGIMLAQAESAQDVLQADAALGELERERGISIGSIQIIVLIESPRAVWDIRSIISASARVTQAGLDESDLAASMRINPLPEYDPFIYARGRLVVEATAAGVLPVGMAYPLGLQASLMPAEELNRMANNARNSGMKGVVCPHASWVEPVNRAFTPTDELVAYNRRVRELFAAGVAAGTAAVPLDGRMIDVPVDEWAKVVIATAEACAVRDEEKRRAMGA